MKYKIDGFEKDKLLLNETIFHNANGYLGVRSCFEEGCDMPSIRGMYVNGFYDFAEMKQAEKLCGFVDEKQTMLNVADTQGIAMTVEGERFSLFHGEILSFSRELDMEKGVTVRRAVWRSPGGRELELTVRRMASFHRLSLFLTEYSVTALNFSGMITLESTHIGQVYNYCNANDPRVAAEQHQHILVKSRHFDGHGHYIVSKTSKSGLEVCTGVSHRTDGIVEWKDSTATITRHAECGKAFAVYKYTVVSDSRRHADCLAYAKARMSEALATEPETLYAEQESYLSAYWERCALNITGDDDLNLSVRYNQFQLLQSVTKDSVGNISAKGLSGEGYEGHYFWDTEMYIQPAFVLTQPELVKNLIAFRYGTLELARKNAAILGHKKGALFPWRTIMGKECSGYFPSGTAQYHINGDIAYSVIQYYLATGDMGFIEQMGAELLLEISRLWLDVGNYSGGRFVINAVTGPDEYTCMVNNNYYTNLLAKHSLIWTVKLIKAVRGNLRVEVTDAELDSFMDAASAMFLPYDDALGINPQDDSFLSKPVWDFENEKNYPLLLHYHPLLLYRYQVCKQADVVLAHYILEDYQDEDTIRRSFDYYEKITTHDSSLSTCIFSIVASKLGLSEKAYHYFGDSAKLDLFNTHGNTGDGIHTANMGGVYMAIVYGFAGLRIKEDGLYISPKLPKAWNSLEFKATYKGSVINILITHNGCETRLVSGEPRPVFVV